MSPSLPLRLVLGLTFLLLLQFLFFLPLFLFLLISFFLLLLIPLFARNVNIPPTAVYVVVVIHTPTEQSKALKLQYYSISTFLFLVLISVEVSASSYVVDVLRRSRTQVDEVFIPDQLNYKGDSSLHILFLYRFLVLPVLSSGAAANTNPLQIKGLVQRPPSSV